MVDKNLKVLMLTRNISYWVKKRKSVRNTLTVSLKPLTLVTASEVSDRFLLVFICKKNLPKFIGSIYLVLFCSLGTIFKHSGYLDTKH